MSHIVMPAPMFQAKNQPATLQPCRDRSLLEACLGLMGVHVKPVPIFDI